MPRVTVRKGSNSALDPHGVHFEMNMNPSRSLSSILTIVRVQPISDLTRIHSTTRTPPSDPINRVSFAFSSFSQANSDQLPSPSSSPPSLRSSLPIRGRSDSSSGKPRLSPDQLVDLARQATNPKSLPACTSPPTTPTFTPLPDDIYLPFIDRPSEVAALISSPPDLNLFSLLAQTFPKNNSIITITDQTVQLPSDSTQWSYHHLIHYLTHIDRDTAPDPIWVIATRKCIHSHSELIWERIKGALGIPPELDHNQRSPPSHQEASLDDVSPDFLSIEPLLAVPPSSASTSFSSLSNRLPGDALDDIAEAEEDETESVFNAETTSGPGLVMDQGAESLHSSSPARVQGLKFSTSLIQSSNSYSTPLMMSPSSPLTPYPPAGTRRDGGWMSDGDRLPGYPLFPSNFTKLAMGPIFRAKTDSDIEGKPRAYSDASVYVKGIQVDADG